VAAAALAAAPAFAATAAPQLGERFEWAEGVLLWLALGVGSLALVPAYLRGHRRALPLALFGGGIASLAAAHSLELGGIELGGTVLGVALVAGAHVANLRAHAGVTKHAHSH
jgi:hypothetical protein